MSALDDLMAQYSPQITDDMRKRALSQGLLGAGFGILANAANNPWVALGKGGLLGVQARNESLVDQQRTNMQGLQARSAGLDVLNKQDAYDQAVQERQTLAEHYRKAGLPGATPTAPTPDAMPQAAPQGPAQVQTSPVAPTDAPQAAPQQPQGGPPPSMDGGISNRRAMSAQLRQIGDELAAKGLGIQATKYYEQADKMLPELKEQKVMMNNGKPIAVNFYKDGSREVVPYSPAEKAHFGDTGSAIQAFDPYTAAPIGVATPKTLTPGEKVNSDETARWHGIEAGFKKQEIGLSGARLAQEVRRNDIMEGDPASIESMAKMIANGEMPPPSGFAAARPAALAIMNRVQQINPDYSAKDFTVGKKAEQDFATGKQGNSVRSFNVALTHLDTLGQLADALHNKNMPLVNKIGNVYAQQTGDAAPTNFETAKQIVANEIVKAIVGSGGGVGDRDKAQQTVDKANSPAQLAGAINTYKALMKGQLGGLRQQYETSTKRKDFDRFLSPEAKTMVSDTGASDVRSAADKILQGK